MLLGPNSNVCCSNIGSHSLYQTIKSRFLLLNLYCFLVMFRLTDKGGLFILYSVRPSHGRHISSRLNAYDNMKDITIITIKLKFQCRKNAIDNTLYSNLSVIRYSHLLIHNICVRTGGRGGQCPPPPNMGLPMHLIHFDYLRLRWKPHCPPPITKSFLRYYITHLILAHFTHCHKIITHCPEIYNFAQWTRLSKITRGTLWRNIVFN